MFIWFGLDLQHNRAIGLMSRVFPSGPEDRGSIPGQVVPKTQKWYLMPPSLTFRIISLRIKGKVERSREWSSALPPHLGVVAIEKGTFVSPSTKVTN